jgi:hypothetical protein
MDLKRETLGFLPIRLLESFAVGQKIMGKVKEL